MLPLPVDAYLERVHVTLDSHRALVLTAAPGAGKTTRIPPALIDRGRVLLLQPRRVAARAVARRIAEERGWTIGREVGWHIRFERQFTKDTRLLVVTEGILTAYLQDDPLLSDISTIVIDEFHERSIHADLGLALAKQAWFARPDLHIVVMSATLDTRPVSAFLRNCPTIEVPGTLHRMTMEYAPGQSVARAVEDVLPRTIGHVLCFLPGAGEIAATIAELGPRQDVDVVPLHGSLDGREQDAALASDEVRRRIIVATNIAETSLTVPGVSVVIDTGVHKVARYDAERGVDSLTTERVTLDSADQRAGRAARLGPGLVRRLWDERDRLRPHREPEIDRVDLAGPVLSLLAWGADPRTFEWFDRPSDDRIARAVTLLERLGAVADGQVTAIGRQLQRLPLHPRLGRVLLAAKGSAEGAAACAWLSEPGRFTAGRAATSCDLLPIIDRWSQVPPHLRHAADQLQRSARAVLGDGGREHINDVELRRALLAGYPDRVAKRRSIGRFTLATGHGAIIGRDSGVHDADWIVALDVTSGRVSPATEAIVRLASRIEPEWLQPTRCDTVVEMNAEIGTVTATEVDWYDELRLREHRVAPPPAERARLLADAWMQRGPDERSKRLLQRLTFAGLGADARAMVTTAAQSATRLDDLVLTEDHIEWDVRRRLQSLAPDRITVPSGRDMVVEYKDDGSAFVAVKLQELFGLAETPRLGPNRVPVTFELLAPNGRAVQTTQDLKSFWERTYPEVRKELRGRYPRHPWPEDPWNAPPTHRTKRR